MLHPISYYFAHAHASDYILYPVVYKHDWTKLWNSCYPVTVCFHSSTLYCDIMLHLCFLFQCHITSNSDIRKDLQDLLAEDDLNVVLSSNHRPRCIIEFISQSLQILDFGEQRRSVMVAYYVYHSTIPL
jgi:hypothetical protein